LLRVIVAGNIYCSQKG